MPPPALDPPSPPSPRRAARARHRPKAFAMTTSLDRPTDRDNFSRPSGKPAGRHRITVREADDRHGRFEMLLPDGVTLPASRTPLLVAARYLLSEGADPSAVVEMRHAGRPDTWPHSAEWAHSQNSTCGRTKRVDRASASGDHHHRTGARRCGYRSWVRYCAVGLPA